MAGCFVNKFLLNGAENQLFPSILSDDNRIAWEVSGIMGLHLVGIVKMS